MAKFAAQLKDRFLGLVERVAGCGRGAGDKGVKGTHQAVNCAARRD
ncbi:hypothetical protein EE612_025825 [Oryza sativa]|nr:hypothetical protein EE612_025825 [Oryza sativa]